MARFSLVTNNDTTFDGIVVAAGNPVATIETDLAIDNVLSAVRIGMVSMVRLQAEEVVAQTAALVQPVAKATKAKASEPEAAKPEPVIEPKVDDLIDDDFSELDPLAGLTPKIAESLKASLSDGKPVANGPFDTPEKVQAAIDAGVNLEDLDGIGKAAVVKIKDWLKALKGE